MAIDPNRPPLSETIRLIQRTTFADLPQPNSVVPTGSPPVAGLYAWVENSVGPNLAGLYLLRWITQSQHVWTYIGPGTGATLLPDQRFTVGSSDYNLFDPGTATFTTVQSGITGATAGTGTSLPAVPSQDSSRLVEVLPLRYIENLTLAPHVGLRGMGASPRQTILEAPPVGDLLTIPLATAGDIFFVENVTLRGPVSIPAAAKGSVSFRDCFFDNPIGTTLITATVAVGETLTLIFESCSGQVQGISVSGGGSCEVIFRGNEDGSTIFGSLGTVTPITFDCDGFSSVYTLLDAVLERLGVGGPLFSFMPTSAVGSGIMILGRSVLLNSTGGIIAPWSICGPTAGVMIVQVFDVLSQNIFLGWCDSLCPNTSIQIADYTIPSQDVDPLARPLGSTVPILTGAPSLRGNRLRNIRRYGSPAGSLNDTVFNVPPAVGSVLNDFYVTNLPNLGGLSNSAAFDVFADSHYVQANYGDLALGPINIDAAPANVGVLFRYALFELPDPLEIEDGREYAIVNVGDPSDPTRGPVAICLPNIGPGTSRINHMNSRPLVQTLIAPSDYLLLAPGAKIRLEVDRERNQYVVT